MLSYYQQQTKLFNHLEKQFKKGMPVSEIVPIHKDYVNDDRICFTSVVFVPKNISKNIQKNFINPLQKIDNSQYYYPADSMHLTIQNVRTISSPKLFTKDDIEKVKDLFKNIIPKFHKFKFRAEGIFETPTSLSVKCFSNSYLRDLVLALRIGLDKIGVPDNKNYGSDSVFFGNISFCRYYQKPTKDFFAQVHKLKNIEIGEMAVSKISLITTNAVASPQKTKIIAEYNLLV